MNKQKQDPAIGVAVGLSINDALFYDIFHAGDIFEQDKRYSISEHNDITVKTRTDYPDFADQHLSIFCEIYNHARLADNGVRTFTIVDELEKARLVTDYTNAHPELPDAWDFMEIYYKIAKDNQQVIILPHCKKIVELRGLTIEQILKQ